MGVLSPHGAKVPQTRRGVSQFTPPCVVIQRPGAAGKIDMRKSLYLATIMLLTTGQAMAVSVWELSQSCGDDAEIWCDGVAYGEAMQACIDANYAELTQECQAIADRLRAGEKVSLF